MAAPGPGLSTGLRKGWLPSLLGLGSLLLLWQVAAWIVASSLILPQPHEAFLAFLGLLGQLDFYLGILASLARTLLSFSLCLLIAFPLGLAMGFSDFARSFFSPLMAILRSMPAISVIILGIIWFGKDTSPIWVSLLMTVPILTQAIAEGVASRDLQLETMGQAYGLSSLRRLWRITIPGLVPFLRSGGRSSLGIGWKVVANAEVLAMPLFGLGSRLQDARTFLETGEVFAITATLVIVAALGDMVLKHALVLPHEKRGGAR